MVGAPVLVCLLSLVAVVMATVWTEDSKAVASNRFYAGTLAGFTLLVAFVPSLMQFMCVDDKEMGEMMNVQRDANTRIESTTWTPLCRVDVVTNDKAQLIGYTEHAPGTYKVVTQDGTANTRIPSKVSVDQIVGEIQGGKDWRRFNAVYQLKKKPDVAVIGVGGGIDVISALAYDANSIIGIELNPAIYENVQRNHDYMGNILKDPRITLVNQEGRGALRASKKSFDVIQIDAIDTFAALSSGAYVLSENYLYTVEAFEDMFSHLKPGGILSVHRWRFIPDRESLRLTALACEAWKRKGVTDIDKRVIVFGDDTWAVALFKNEAFTVEEFETVKAYADKLKEGICLWPKVYSPEAQRAKEDAYYKDADPKLLICRDAFNGCVQGYATGNEKAFFDSYIYNVTPTTDDSPFFFEYHRLNWFGMYQAPQQEVLSAGPSQADSLRGENNVGTTIFLILGQSTVFILLAVFWPLIRYQRQGIRFPGAIAWSGYFAAIGLGFMVVEIGVIQKCVLFLGNPMYSLSVVLASILVSAGLGSHFFATRGWDAAFLTRRIGPLFLLGAVGINFGLNPLFYQLLHLPLAARMAVVVAAMFPLGFPMGMFFPAGLQAVRQRATAFVPWAWGINGCASVYGSIIAILIAMVHGFDTAVVAGAVIYGIGFVFAQFALAKQPASEDVTSDSATAEPALVAK
jgi:spermidine synthase